MEGHVSWVTHVVDIFLSFVQSSLFMEGAVSGGIRWFIMKLFLWIENCTAGSTKCCCCENSTYFQKEIVCIIPRRHSTHNLSFFASNIIRWVFLFAYFYVWNISQVHLYFNEKNVLYFPRMGPPYYFIN